MKQVALHPSQLNDLNLLLVLTHLNHDNQRKRTREKMFLMSTITKKVSLKYHRMYSQSVFTQYQINVQNSN